MRTRAAALKSCIRLLPACGKAGVQLCTAVVVALLVFTGITYFLSSVPVADTTGQTDAQADGVFEHSAAFLSLQWVLKTHPPPPPSPPLFR